MKVIYILGCFSDKDLYIYKKIIKKIKKTIKKLKRLCMRIRKREKKRLGRIFRINVRGSKE
jgi:hypothetical protein